MGLDLALGIIILVAAFRGWFQGFIIQVVKIASLVGCVYLADPVRLYVKPHVLPYLTSIHSDFIDRGLWWVSAIFLYLTLVGLATLIIKMTRRPEIPGITQSARNDQFAGFLLGTAKGLLVAAVATAAIQKFAIDQVKTVAWAHDQVSASWAIKWNDEYRPASRIWSSLPVRRFVAHFRRMALPPALPGQSPADGDRDREPEVRTASRHPGLEIAGQDGADNSGGNVSGTTSVSPPPEPGLLDTETEKVVQDIKAEMKARPQRPN
jgi:uncharacterized membrane protein required for colicin V production